MVIGDCMVIEFFASLHVLRSDVVSLVQVVLQVQVVMIGIMRPLDAEILVVSMVGNACVMQLTVRVILITIVAEWVIVQI